LPKVYPTSPARASVASVSCAAPAGPLTPVKSLIPQPTLPSRGPPATRPVLTTGYA
jgi:hypothetical protein